MAGSLNSDAYNLRNYLPDNKYASGGSKELQEYISAYSEITVPEPDFPKRKATEGIKPFLKMALSASKEVGLAAIRRQMEQAFPKTTKTVLDMQMVATSTADQIREISRNVSPELVKLSRGLKRFYDRGRNYLPVEIRRRIDIAYGELDKAKAGGSLARLGVKFDPRDYQIESAINNAIKQQMEVTTALADETRVYRQIETLTENVRFAKSASLLSSIDRSLLSIDSFHRSVHVEFLKRQLELQYKQLYTMQDSLELLKVAMPVLESKLAEITHNTSIPDYQKTRGVEKGKHDAEMAMVKGLGQKLYMAPMNAIMKLGAAGIGRIGSAIKMASQAQGEDEDLAHRMMMDSIGHDGSRLNDETFGKMDSRMFKLKMLGAKGIGKVAGGLAGTRFGRWTANKFSPGTGVDDKMSTVLRSPEDYVSQLLGASKWKNSKNWFIKLLGESMSEDFGGGVVGGEESETKATAFDMATRRSIVEIIPAYLSRQLIALETLAFGGTPEAVIFNPVTKRLEGKKAVRESIIGQALGVKTTDKTANQTRLQHEAGLVGDIIAKERVLEKEGVKVDERYEGIDEDLLKMVGAMRVEGKGFSREAMRADLLTQHRKKNAKAGSTGASSPDWLAPSEKAAEQLYLDMAKEVKKHIAAGGTVETFTLPPALLTKAQKELDPADYKMLTERFFGESGQLRGDYKDAVAFVEDMFDNQGEVKEFTGFDKSRAEYQDSNYYGKALTNVDPEKREQLLKYLYKITGGGNLGGSKDDTDVEFLQTLNQRKEGGFSRAEQIKKVLPEILTSYGGALRDAIPDLVTDDGRIDPAGIAGVLLEGLSDKDREDLNKSIENTAKVNTEYYTSKRSRQRGAISTQQTRSLVITNLMEAVRAYLASGKNLDEFVIPDDIKRQLDDIGIDEKEIKLIIKTVEKDQRALLADPSLPIDLDKYDKLDTVRGKRTMDIDKAGVLDGLARKAKLRTDQLVAAKGIGAKDWELRPDKLVSENAAEKIKKTPMEVWAEQLQVQWDIYNLLRGWFGGDGGFVPPEASGPGGSGGGFSPSILPSGSNPTGKPQPPTAPGSSKRPRTKHGSKRNVRRTSGGHDAEPTVDMTKLWNLEAKRKELQENINKWENLQVETVKVPKIFSELITPIRQAREVLATVMTAEETGKVPDNFKEAWDDYQNSVATVERVKDAYSKTKDAVKKGYEQGKTKVLESDTYKKGKAKVEETTQVVRSQMALRDRLGSLKIIIAGLEKQIAAGKGTKKIEEMLQRAKALEERTTRSLETNVEDKKLIKAVDTIASQYTKLSNILRERANRLHKNTDGIFTKDGFAPGVKRFKLAMEGGRPDDLEEGEEGDFATRMGSKVHSTADKIESTIGRARSGLNQFQNAPIRTSFKLLTRGIGLFKNKNAGPPPIPGSNAGAPDGTEAAPVNEAEVNIAENTEKTNEELAKTNLTLEEVTDLIEKLIETLQEDKHAPGDTDRDGDRDNSFDDLQQSREGRLAKLMRLKSKLSGKGGQAGGVGVTGLLAAATGAGGGGGGGMMSAIGTEVAGKGITKTLGKVGARIFGKGAAAKAAAAAAGKGTAGAVSSKAAAAAAAKGATVVAGKGAAGAAASAGGAALLAPAVAIAATAAASAALGYAGYKTILEPWMAEKEKKEDEERLKTQEELQSNLQEKDLDDSAHKHRARNIRASKYGAIDQQELIKNITSGKLDLEKLSPDQIEELSYVFRTRTIERATRLVTHAREIRLMGGWTAAHEESLKNQWNHSLGVDLDTWEKVAKAGNRQGDLTVIKSLREPPDFKSLKKKDTYDTTISTLKGLNETLDGPQLSPVARRAKIRELRSLCRERTGALQDQLIDALQKIMQEMHNINERDQAATDLIKQYNTAWKADVTPLAEEMLGLAKQEGKSGEADVKLAEELLAPAETGAVRQIHYVIASIKKERAKVAKKIDLTEKHSKTSASLTPREHLNNTYEELQKARASKDPKAIKKAEEKWLSANRAYNAAVQSGRPTGDEEFAAAQPAATSEASPDTTVAPEDMSATNHASPETKSTEYSKKNNLAEAEQQQVSLSTAELQELQQQQLVKTDELLEVMRSAAEAMQGVQKNTDGMDKLGAQLAESKPTVVVQQVNASSQGNTQPAPANSHIDIHKRRF